MKALLSAKIGQRLNIVTDIQLLPELLNMDPAHLPIELGGNFEMDTPEILLDNLLQQNIIV